MRFPCAPLLGGNLPDLRLHGADDIVLRFGSDQPHSLPHTRQNRHLDVLSSHQIVPEGENGGAAFRVELQHFDWVPHIEMEHLIRVEDVHLRKLPLLQQVIDRGALRTGSAREFDIRCRGIGSPESAPLNRVRSEIKQSLYLVSRHSEIVYEPVKLTL